MRTTTRSLSPIGMLLVACVAEPDVEVTRGAVDEAAWAAVILPDGLHRQGALLLPRPADGVYDFSLPPLSSILPPPTEGNPGCQHNPWQGNPTTPGGRMDLPPPSDPGQVGAPGDTRTWLQPSEGAAEVLRRAESEGGGILVLSSDVTVKNAWVRCGGVGIAVLGDPAAPLSGVRLLDNRLAYQSAWGIYVSDADAALIQGNEIEHVNRYYKELDGNFLTGAESAAVMAIRLRSSMLADNRCFDAADCYYLLGVDGGWTSSRGVVIAGNWCVRAKWWCFEATNADGLELRDNIAGIREGDERHPLAGTYGTSGNGCSGGPLLLTGSTGVVEGGNVWDC